MGDILHPEVIRATGDDVTTAPAAWHERRDFFRERENDYSRTVSLSLMIEGMLGYKETRSAPWRVHLRLKEEIGFPIATLIVTD